MKVTITPNKGRGDVARNRKENNFFAQYTVYTPRGSAILTARLYATPSRTYACVWLYVPAALAAKAHRGEGLEGIYNSGGGYAGGYGYHRASAAIQAALDNAGISLDQDIAGRGDSVMQEALIAVAQAAVYQPLRKKLFIGVAHA